MESDILRQHSLALSSWPSKIFKSHKSKRRHLHNKGWSSKASGQVSSVSSTERDINTRLAKAWTAIDRLSVIWKSDLTYEIKCGFLLVVVSILLYGCITWTLNKRMEKKLDGNYTRMLRVISNKSWRQYSTKQQLYGHLPIQVRRTRHAGHCWRSKGELISDVLLWTLSHGRGKVGRPAITYLQQLCTDRGCSLENLPGTMDNWDKWRERVREIHASSAT